MRAAWGKIDIMTTAAETVRNILSLSPVIDRRETSLGTLIPLYTATEFVDNNFKHIVNRRLIWSKVEKFVHSSLELLARSISGNITGLSVDFAVEYSYQSVRICLNRRWSWTEARPVLIEAVQDVILAAERLL